MANKAISTLAVGSSVYLNVGGVRKEFLVVHQGKPSSLYDSSCDGTWLLMKDCYTSRAWSDYSSNNYKIAAINTYLNGPFLGLFDADIQGSIKQVKIPYVNGTGGAAVASGAGGLSCKVFLLGGCEVGIPSTGNVPSDGVKLDYFDSTMSTDTKRVANLNGSPMGWALRSADSNTSNTIWFITVRGAPNNYQSYANGSFGIRPALVLPSTTLVDDSGNVVIPDLTAHKTLVNGTVYEVKGGKCLVNGTVYSIKKGRTLIGGTGYDITFPYPLVMPVKGDIITMNLDGTDRQYRVLKIVDGTTVEVLGMWDDMHYSAFGKDSRYSNSALDNRLNTTWYNTLSTAAKAAIVPKNIVQDYWYWSNSTILSEPYYSGKYGATYPGTTAYTVSKNNVSAPVNIGSRYVYAMSVQEVIDYLSDSNVLYQKDIMLMNANIWKMFWDKITRPQTTSLSVLLRSVWSNEANRVWCADPNYGYLGDAYIGNANIARPAFQIDLSKIDFTIN